MKFLFVIPTLLHGGAERVISVLSTALSDIGQDVTIAKYYSADQEYQVGTKVRVRELTPEGIAGYQHMSKVQLISALRRVLIEEKPDVVIPFMFPIAMLTQLAAIGLKMNIVQSIRIDPANGPASRVKRWLRDQLVYHARCTFVQNAQQKAYFKEKYHDRIHILYNPVMDEMFTAEPKKTNGTFVVCSMGRLTDQKNFPLLIRSFQTAFADNESAQLRIYGEGEGRESLEKLIAENGLTGKVKLMGRTNQIRAAYEDADCFVLSSNFEGMPNALIEAMACGVPSISTDCPTGPADLIEHGQNGYLVPVNDVQALDTAMRQLAQMPAEQRLVIGHRGRATISAKCMRLNIAQRMVDISHQYTK